MRKALSTIIILLVLFILAVLVLSHKSEEGFRITIRNQLDQTIPQLTLVYPNGSQAFSMKASSNRTIHVVPNNFGEGSIVLQYDGEQTKHEIIVFGYIENGYRGKADIRINSVSDQGELQVTVEHEDHLY